MESENKLHFVPRVSLCHEESQDQRPALTSPWFASHLTLTVLLAGGPCGGVILSFFQAVNKLCLDELDQSGPLPSRVFTFRFVCLVLLKLLRLLAVIHFGFGSVGTSLQLVGPV